MLTTIPRRILALRFGSPPGPLANEPVKAAHQIALAAGAQVRVWTRPAFDTAAEIADELRRESWRFRPDLIVVAAEHASLGMELKRAVRTPVWILATNGFVRPTRVVSVVDLRESTERVLDITERVATTIGASQRVAMYVGQPELDGRDDSLFEVDAQRRHRAACAMALQARLRERRTWWNMAVAEGPLSCALREMCQRLRSNTLVVASPACPAKMRWLSAEAPALLDEQGVAGLLVLPQVARSVPRDVEAAGELRQRRAV